MDKFLIQGGQRLLGEVEISGSKNATLPLLAAVLLSGCKSILRNVPDLVDVKTMCILLEQLGARCTWEGELLSIDTTDAGSYEASYEVVRKMRTSILVLGPLLARFKSARISLPGGCAIGNRPVDIHLDGLRALGANVELEHGYVHATAPEGLRAAEYHLPFPSVGATQQLMMAASLAKGTTRLVGCALEPEVNFLATALLKMGADIRGIGTAILEIQGVENLRPLECSIEPDRIETGTFIAAAAISHGDILIKNVHSQALDAILQAFSKMGCDISYRGEGLRIVGPKRLRAGDISTAPYPGYPTDMQAQYMACATLADGASVIRECIFENRFMHALELMRMGAKIEISHNQAIVRGIEQLQGAPVMATDLRASVSLILAALAAQGQSEILRIYHLDRGYVRLENKLQKLGAEIVRVPQDENGRERE